MLCERLIANSIYSSSLAAQYGELSPRIRHHRNFVTTGRTVDGENPLVIQEQPRGSLHFQRLSKNRDQRTPEDAIVSVRVLMQMGNDGRESASGGN